MKTRLEVNSFTYIICPHLLCTLSNSWQASYFRPWGTFVVSCTVTRITSTTSLTDKKLVSWSYFYIGPKRWKIAFHTLQKEFNASEVAFPYPPKNCHHQLSCKTLPFELLSVGEDWCFHTMLCCLLCGSNWWTHVSSMVTVQPRNT